MAISACSKIKLHISVFVQYEKYRRSQQTGDNQLTHKDHNYRKVEGVTTPLGTDLVRMRAIARAHFPAVDAPPAFLGV